MKTDQENAIARTIAEHLARRPVQRIVADEGLVTVYLPPYRSRAHVVRAIVGDVEYDVQILVTRTS